MVFEIARIRIDPERIPAFEAAVAQAERHFRNHPDCKGFALQKVLEEIGVFHLVVGWTSVEAHMVDFRSTKEFQEWRALASSFFIEAPTVIHTETVIGEIHIK
jgi:quinol monooxygenase YgiN